MSHDVQPPEPPRVEGGRSRAFWIETPGRGAIRDESLADPGPDEVLVRTLFSGISRGTEALVFQGRVPPGEYARMRAPFQTGEFPGPVKYGYASVGVVERGPTHLIDRTVFVLHPHQTRYVVPVAATHLLPVDVAPPRAVLAANMETALNVTWDATPRPGDRITVIGAGTVGCLVAFLVCRIPGCHVELVDLNPRRAAVAAALGAHFAEPPGATRNRDVVIHASGGEAGLSLAIDLAGFEARIVEASWYGDRPVTVPLGGAFHAQRLTIASSQVGAVASGQRARWDTRRRMQTALSLLADDALDALITGETDFESLPALMATLARDARDTICHRIRYSP